MQRISRTLLAFVLTSAFIAASAMPPDATVYVVEKGKKYHVKNCRLKQNSHAMKLSEAKKKGYTPCKVCNPVK